MLGRQRQINWEENRIDYMGADAFDNIRKRLDEIILGDLGSVNVEEAVDALLGRRDVGTMVPEEWRCECEDLDDDLDEDEIEDAITPTPDVKRLKKPVAMNVCDIDVPALPPYVLTGQQGERPSQSFIGERFVTIP